MQDPPERNISNISNISNITAEPNNGLSSVFL
jgi:hypothetical protein